MEMSDEMLDSCILLVSNAGKALLGPGPDEELSTEMKILAKLADGQVRSTAPQEDYFYEAAARACS